MGSLFSSTTNNTSWTAQGKNVLITGASGGIGAALAREFAEQGATNLALVARSQEKLQKVADECTSLGGGAAATTAAHVIPCDLTGTNEQIQKAFQQAIAKLDGRVDVVVLNAGRSQGCYFEEIQDVTQIDYMLELNVGGVIKAAHYCMPAIPKAATSRIVLISSVSGLIGVPYRTIYCATKHALTGFANSLRCELNDTYALEAPAVCLINFPEVSGTVLNAGRMDFGATQKPAQFDTTGVMTVQEASQGCFQAVAQGQREWGHPLKMSLLLPLYRIIPAVLDGIILKIVKKTHSRPE